MQFLEKFLHDVLKHRMAMRDDYGIMLHVICDESFGVCVRREMPQRLSCSIKSKGTPIYRVPCEYYLAHDGVAGK